MKKNQRQKTCWTVSLKGDLYCMGWVGFESCRIQSLERSTGARGLPLLICIRPAAPDFCLWHGVRPRGRQAHVWRISFQFSHSQSLVRGGGIRPFLPPPLKVNPAIPPLGNVCCCYQSKIILLGVYRPLLFSSPQFVTAVGIRERNKNPAGTEHFVPLFGFSPPPQPFISIAFCFLSRVGNLLIHSFIQNRSF